MKNIDKQAALRIAKQAGAAYDFAAAKGGNSVSGRTIEKFKRINKIKGNKREIPVVTKPEEKEKKKPFKPGSVGLSQVSTAIKEDYDIVMSRRKRKEFAKFDGVPFKAYYNN